MLNAHRTSASQVTTSSGHSDTKAQCFNLDDDRSKRQSGSLGGGNTVARRASDGRSGSTEQPRYIALPDDLYALRHRFPSVLHTLQLECTRCRRWVAVDVLSSIPEEVATVAPRSVDAIVADSALQRLSCVDGASSSSGSRDNTTALHSRRRGRSGVGDAPETMEWHSPRLRACAELRQAVHTERDANVTSPGRASDLRCENALLDSLAPNVKKARRGGVICEPVMSKLFIPNPANFVCPWQSCERADLLLDLRQEWLARLYETLKAKTGLTVVDALPSDSVVEPEVDVRPQSSQTALNATLAHELGVRRSKRLANRPQRDSLNASFDPAHRDGANPAVVGSPSRAGSLCADQEQMLRATVSSLAMDADTFFSAFCWVVCERCGKLRRVAQPFPGGAPFICALAASAGSCALSENDALQRYTDEYVNGELAEVARAGAARRRAALQQEAVVSPHVGQESCNVLAHSEYRTGDDLTRNIEDVAAEGVRREQSRRPWDALKNILGDDAIVEAVRATCGFVDVPSPHTELRTRRGMGHQGGLCVHFPLIRELAACVRKRSMGGLLAQVALAPDAIRRKRDEVLRGLITDTPAAAPAASTSARSIGEDKRRPRRTASLHPCNSSRKRAHHPNSPPPSTSSGAGVVHDVDTQPLSAPNSQEVHDGDVVVFSQPAPHRGRGRAGKQPITNVPLYASAATRRGAGRGRKAARCDENDTQQLDSDDEDVIHWVLCDRCGKWRVVPRPVSKSLTYWECHMRDEHTTCDDTDDETRMQKGKVVL